jgi:hypothetical protein
MFDKMLWCRQPVFFGSVQEQDGRISFDGRMKLRFGEVGRLVDHEPECLPLRDPGAVGPHGSIALRHPIFVVHSFESVLATHLDGCEFLLATDAYNVSPEIAVGLCTHVLT